MREHLVEINRSLRALDEAHLQGRISREDYRARRRHLLETLCDGGGITTRHVVLDETVPRTELRARSGAQPVSKRASGRGSWWSRLASRKRRDDR